MANRRCRLCVLLLTAVALHLAGCGKGRSTGSGPASDSTPSTAPSTARGAIAAPHADLTGDADLAAVARAAPPGLTVSPETPYHQRFSDQVIELLRAAPNFEMKSAQMVVAPAPAAVTDKYLHSSDPLVRQLAELDSKLAVEGPAFGAAEKQLVEANFAVLTTSPRTHTEEKREFRGSVDSHGVSHGGFVTREEQVEDANQPEIGRAVDGSFQAHDEHYERRFQLYTHVQELGVLLKQIARTGRHAAPAGGAIGIGFNDDLKQLGTVLVKNRSDLTFHHCLVIVVGEQNPAPKDPDAVNGALTSLARNFVGATGGPHEAEEAAMPSVSIAYVDDLAPGEGLLSTCCMSGDLSRVKAVSAAFWSDEVETGDVPVDNMEETLRRIKDNHAADARAIDQSLVDQRKTVHVTCDHGMILYQFQAFPRINSDTIVVPEGTKQMRVIYPAGAQVQEQVDGLPVSTQDPNFIPGMKLRFHVMGNDDGPPPAPVPVAVRFLLRDPTDEEKKPFELPPWPPAAPAPLPPQRQAEHDTLVAWLSRGPSADGTAVVRNVAKPQPLHVQLHWDAESDSFSGSVQWDRDGTKKLVQGRILDDPDAPPTLLFWETQWQGMPANPGNSCGIAYAMTVQETDPGHLVIRSAKYGDFKTNRVIDVTDAIKALVADDSLKCPVSRQGFSDPAPRVVKTLQVEYTAVDGSVKTVSAAERQTLTLAKEATPPRGSLSGVWRYTERNMFGTGVTGTGSVVLTTDVNGKPPAAK